ncbi:MAG: hypothetical protein ACYC28_15980 [Longimicrobiales bacterium]
MANLYRSNGTSWVPIDPNAETKFRSVGWTTNPVNVYAQCSADENSPDWQQLIAAPVPVPTEKPGTPVLSASGGVLTATWTNTTNEWEAQVVFECITNLMYSGNSLRPAGSTSATHDPANPNVESFRCRLQYFNDAGQGPFSEWSNVIFSQG